MTAAAVSAVAIAAAVIYSLAAGALARFPASTTASATVTLFPTGGAAADTMAITIGVKRRGDRPGLMDVIVEERMMAAQLDHHYLTSRRCLGNRSHKAENFFGKLSIIDYV